MTRILLLNPPFYRFLGSHNNDSRIGLGYLSAVLRRAGYDDVHQYNCDYVPSKDYANQKALFSSSEDFIENVKKPHHPVYVEIYNKIDELKPDIVGMTVMAGTVVQSEMIAKYCHDHGIRTMVGGTMVTLALSEMVKRSFYDQLIAGEGEKVIVQAVEHPERRMIVGTNTTNLDTLPFPDRDNYIHDSQDMGHASIQTARGCNMRCLYCSNHLLGGEIRFRSPGNVVAEIMRIQGMFDQKYFRFFDDTFTVNHARVYKFCDLILKKKINIEFLIETRVDTLNKDVIQALKTAGLKSVKLGIESGSERILKIYKPQYTKDKVRDIVRILKEEDINVSLNWMFGFPEETDDDLRDSIAFARELKADYNTISSLAPYYGTDLFDRLPPEDKKEWRGYFHTSIHPVMNKNLSIDLINEFLGVNDK